MRLSSDRGLPSITSFRKIEPNTASIHISNRIQSEQFWPADSLTVPIFTFRSEATCRACIGGVPSVALNVLEDLSLGPPAIGQSVEAWGKNYCYIDLILDLTLSWSFEKNVQLSLRGMQFALSPSSLATCFFVESWVPVPSNATANILHHIWDASPVKVALWLCFSSQQSAKFLLWCSRLPIWQKINDVNTRDGTFTKELIGSYQLKIFYETRMVIIHASCLHEKNRDLFLHTTCLYCSFAVGPQTLSPCAIFITDGLGKFR